MLLIGCTSARPRPRGLGTATVDPAPRCIAKALPELDQMRERGQLDRVVDRLERLQSSCDDEEVDRELFAAYLAQDRWAEARLELKGKTWPDRDALARRLAAAEARAQDPWSLLGQAKTAAPPEAQRLLDRALAGFMRTTGQRPEVAFVDPLPRWTKAGKRTIFHGALLLGGEGVVIEEPNARPRWVSGRFEPLTEEVALFGLRSDVRLWNLSTGKTKAVGPWPDHLHLSPHRNLVLLPSRPAKVYRLSDLAEVAAHVRDPKEESAEVSWLDDEHLLLEGDQTLAVYSLRQKVIAARAGGYSPLMSPDKKHFAAIERVSDAKLRVVVTDMRTGEKRVDVELPNSTSFIAFSPDGRLVLIRPGADLSIFDLPSGRRRRVAKLPALPTATTPPSTIEVSEDGDICLFGQFRAEPDCEPTLAIRSDGRVLPLRGPRAMTCVRGSHGGVRIAPRFRGALTPGRKMVPNGGSPGYVNCNGAVGKDGHTMAWFEAASGPQGWERPVVVVYDDASGNILHTIPIDAKNAQEVGMSLEFSDGRLRVEYNERSFAVDVAAGRIEAWHPIRPWLSESPTDDERSSFSAEPMALTTLEPPWGVWGKATRWDLRTLRGVHRDAERLSQVDEVSVGTRRLELADSMVWFEQSGTFLGVRFFSTDLALVHHERGRLEPIGFPDESLRCAFGDTVTPWSVCAERITPARGYRELLDLAQNDDP